MLNKLKELFKSPITLIVYTIVIAIAVFAYVYDIYSALYVCLYNIIVFYPAGFILAGKAIETERKFWWILYGLNIAILFVFVTLVS